MFTTLVEVPTEDLQRFVSVFATRGAAMRRKHGSRRAEAFRGADDPNRVYLVIDWESREAFERFRADPEVAPTMQSGGITAPPRFTFVARVAEFPG